MWIYLTDAFLSIIDPDKVSGRHRKSEPLGLYLLVRARFKGDLERVFGAECAPHVVETEDRDYRFRLTVKREIVAGKIAGQIREIDYGNFKGATSETWRHDAYLSCWTAMSRAQSERGGRRKWPAPASGKGRRWVGMDDLLDHPHAPPSGRARGKF